MIDEKTIRTFYQRLNHSEYGVTELVVIDPGPKGVIATGFFDNETDFVRACSQYNGKYNIYAGRNPRTRQFFFRTNSRNQLDTEKRQRAKDSNIKYITAVSLDIDPIRNKGTSSTDEQHKAAIDFALKVQKDIGGWVDDSGNGAYLWIPLETSIIVNHENREEIKEKCRLWQTLIIKEYQPDRHGLRIDGCFDLSRVKKVIGTESVKGNTPRLSKFVLADKGSGDNVRIDIVSMKVGKSRGEIRVKPGSELPNSFLKLLKTNGAIQYHWLTPNRNNDASMHDWALGCELIKSGIADAHDLAVILMFNPFGKYQRDSRNEYIQSTVKNLINKSAVQAE